MNQSSNCQAIQTGHTYRSSEIDWSYWLPFRILAGFFLIQTAIIAVFLVILLNKFDESFQPVMAKTIENGERLAKVETEIKGLGSKVEGLGSKVERLESTLHTVEDKIDILIDLQKSNGQ